MKDIKNSDLKILIVDDVPANIKLLSEILKDEGYKIRPVTSGNQAIQIAESIIPDLILLDIMMPDLNGIETCKLLKANPKLSDIPVIFISALNETENIVEALEAGGVDYITKPFKGLEVKARVNTQIKISYQKKQLEELISIKNKFVSVLAHDLRNSVQVFLGFSEVLGEDINAFPPDESKKILKDMNISAKNISKTLENLLEWSYLQDKKVAFTPNLENIYNLIVNEIKNLDQAIQIKNITIENFVDSNLTLNIDKYMISSVFRNLLTNAIKFVDNNGKIIIGCQDNEFEIEFFVKDNGKGIPKNLQEVLLTLKTNININNKTEEHYSGLGLLMCKEFLEYHNGKIWLESKDGEGTTVYFTLPK